MITVELPPDLVLGDFGEAIETLRGAAADDAADAEPVLLEAGAVRRVDGAGLQWLLACLGASGDGSGPALARLRSNAVVDEALRIAGAAERIAGQRVA